MTRITLLFVAFSAVCAANAQTVLIMPDSTNNRLVSFSAFDGSVVNSNVFGLAGGTQVHAMQVGAEIWVSEQVGDRVSRWSGTGTFLGAVTGALDNIRGMALIGSTVYVTNAGTANGAPGGAVRMFDTTGASLGHFLTPNASSPFGILAHQGGMLVSSSAANDDVHRYTLAGTSAGTFHNSTSLNFAEQMDHNVNGNVLVAGFSSNNVVILDSTSGGLVSSFIASGARGVHQLGNGNIIWSNGSGAWVYDVGTGTSTQVYTGGGRYFDTYSAVPEPGTLAAVGAGLVALASRRRKRSGR